MQGEQAAPAAKRATLGASDLGMQLRVKRLEDTQAAFDRTLHWVEQAVVPPKQQRDERAELEARVKQQIDAVTRDVRTSQRLQQEQIDDLLAHKTRQDDVMTEVQKTLQQVAAQVAEHRTDHDGAIDAVQASLRDVQTRQDALSDDRQSSDRQLAAFRDRIGRAVELLNTACVPGVPGDGKGGDPLPQLSISRDKRPPSDGLGPAPKRACPKDRSPAAKRRAFVALLDWISADEERTRGLFNQYLGGKDFLGFLAGNFSSLARRWASECPDEEMAAEVVGLFPTGKPVVRAMMDTLGSVCTSVHERDMPSAGTAHVYRLNVPDARAFFKQVVRRERQKGPSGTPFSPTLADWGGARGSEQYPDVVVD